MRQVTIAVAMIAAIFALSAGSALAITWDEGAGTKSWNAPNNWSGNAVPTSTTPVILDDTWLAMSGDYGLDAAFTIQSLTINSPGLTAINANTSGTTGRTLTLNPTTGIIVGSSANSSIGLGTTAGTGTLTVTMYTAGNTAFDVAGGKTLTVAGPITGKLPTCYLAKNSAGTLILSGTNTYANLATVGAGTIINAGTVQVTANANLGGAAGDVTFGSGSPTLRFATASGLVQPVGRTFIFGNNSGTIEVTNAPCEVDNSNPQFTSGANGVLIKTGAGTLSIRGDNSDFDGTIRLDAGVLEVGRDDGSAGGANQVGDTGGRAKIKMNGGTVAIHDIANRNIVPNVELLASSTLNTSRWGPGAGINHTFAGGALTIDGDYTLNVLSAASPFDSSGQGVTSGAAGITFTGSAEFKGSPTFNVTNPAPAGTTTVLTLGSIIETGGPRGLVKTGNGTLVVTGAIGYTGATSLTGGAMRINNPLGGTARNFTASSGTTVMVGYAIDNTFMQRLVENSNTFIIALAADSFDDVNLDSGASGAALPNVSLGASSDSTYSGVLTPYGTTYRLGGGGANLTVDSDLTGARSLVVTGAGSVILAGPGGESADTFTGATTVSAGTLQINSAGAFNSVARTVTVNAGGTLKFTAADSARAAAVAVGPGTVIFTSASAANGGTFNINSGGSAGFTAASAAAGGIINFSSGGTTNLTVANAVSGGMLNINSGGTATLAAANAGAGGTFNITSGGTATVTAGSGCAGTFNIEAGGLLTVNRGNYTDSYVGSTINLNGGTVQSFDGINLSVRQSIGGNVNVQASSTVDAYNTNGNGCPGSWAAYGALDFADSGGADYVLTIISSTGVGQHNTAGVEFVNSAITQSGTINIDSANRAVFAKLAGLTVAIGKTLTKTGNQPLYVTGFTSGNVAVSAGSLCLNTADAASGGSITVKSGGTLSIGALNGARGANITMESGSAVAYAAAGTATGTIAVNDGVTHISAAADAANGATFTVNPGGILTATNSLTNAFNGTTINLNGGTLRCGTNNGTLAAGGTVTVNASSTLNAQATNADDQTLQFGGLDFAAANPADYPEGYMLDFSDAGTDGVGIGKFVGSIISNNGVLNINSTKSRGELNNTAIRAGKTLTKTGAYGLTLSGTLGVAMLGGAELLGSSSFNMVSYTETLTDTSTFDSGDLWTKSTPAGLITATLDNSKGSIGLNGTASFAAEDGGFVSLTGMTVSETYKLTLALATPGELATVLAQLGKNPDFSNIVSPETGKAQFEFTAPATTSYFAWDNNHNTGSGNWYLGSDLLSVALSTLTLPGDTNNDNVVDAADYITVKQNFGRTDATLGAEEGDFDKNGDVDWADLQTLMANFGTRSVGGAPAAPEPATLGLLALGALAVIRRRRVRKA